jgi:hypothetical protein
LLSGGRLESTRALRGRTRYVTKTRLRATKAIRALRNDKMARPACVPC